MGRAMPEILPALAGRRARRSFDPRPVPAEVEATLWEAVRIAPSHGNSQATRVLVARSADTRARLEAALSEGNRNWAPAAPLLAVVASLPGQDHTQEDSDGTVRELWAFHAGIATGNLLAQATALGLIAHPMAGFDAPAVRAAFGAPGELRVLAVVAIGYPGPVEALPADLQRREQGPQRRLPIATVVADDRWTDENALSWAEYRDREGGKQ
jgi:nitroreductase